MITLQVHASSLRQHHSQPPSMSRFRSIKSFHSSTAMAKFFGASSPAVAAGCYPTLQKVGPSGFCCFSFNLSVASLSTWVFCTMMLLPNVPQLPSLWGKPLVLVLPSRCACSQVAFCHKDWVKKIDVLWCRWPAAAWTTCLGWGSHYLCMKVLILSATTKVDIACCKKCILTLDSSWRSWLAVFEGKFLTRYMRISDITRDRTSLSDCFFNFYIHHL